MTNDQQIPNIQFLGVSNFVLGIGSWSFVGHWQSVVGHSLCLGVFVAEKCNFIGPNAAYCVTIRNTRIIEADLVQVKRSHGLPGDVLGTS